MINYFVIFFYFGSYIFFKNLLLQNICLTQVMYIVQKLEKHVFQNHYKYLLLADIPNSTLFWKVAKYMYHISNIRKIYSIVLIIILWIGLQYVIIRKKKLNVMLLQIMTSVWMHPKISFQKSCSFLSFLKTSSSFIFTSVRISIDIYLYSEKLKCAIIVNFFIIKTDI